jgi:hypothetical protein
LFLACKVEEFPRTLRDVIENTGKVLRRKKAEELTKEVSFEKMKNKNMNSYAFR